MTMTTTTASTATILSMRAVAAGPRTTWGAYGVLGEDGKGISWNTYETVEDAKRDRLYRGRAKIIRLRLENCGVELERTPAEAELFIKELRELSPA